MTQASSDGGANPADRTYKIVSTEEGFAMPGTPEPLPGTGLAEATWESSALR
jgi:hypothetical protein